MNIIPNTKEKKEDLITSYDSPLGNITLASDGCALVGLWFEAQKYYGSTLLPHPLKCHDLPIFEQTRIWLERYFEGLPPEDAPLLRMRGTIFQQRVWHALLSIPYGQTTTYKEITQTIIHKYALRTMSAQAVGDAIAHNPISIIIPCHRVIRSDGTLSGYAGGIERKIKLQHLEAMGYLAPF